MNASFKNIPQCVAYALLKRVMLICGMFLSVYQGSLKAQIISTNGAVISVSGGTVLKADSININSTSTLVNTGTLDLHTLTNGGLLQGNGGYNIGRNFINNGTFTPGTGLVTFNGTGFTQLIGGSNAITFSSVTINNVNGVLLNNSPTINSALNFISGKITTGTNILSLGSGATVSGAGTGKYVFGNLKRSFSVSANLSASFDIGDAANYAPVNLTSANVSAAGTLTASTTGTDHPNIITSGIDPVKNVNRYWSLAAQGGLSATYNATFNYQAADLEAGVSASSLIAKKYSADTWSALTISGTPTTTATSISGATGFGTFAIGMTTLPQATPVFSVASGSVAFGTAVTITSAGADAIYYTINGSDPTTSSNVYTGPIEINAELTLKALAVRAGAPASAISSVSYTQSASADLASIVFSEPVSNYTFSSGSYNYPMLGVPFGVSGITITPTGQGVITVDGVAVNSGQASGNITLTPGVEKIITILVTETGKKAKKYTLKVTSPLSSAKAITAFEIMGNGTVNEVNHSIDVSLPYGTSLTSLAPVIAISGATINPASGAPQDFTNPVTYSVTAQDGTTQDYTVTVTPNQAIPDGGGNVVLNNTTPEALVNSPVQEVIVIVTVTDQVTKPSLDYGSLIVEGTGTIPKTTIYSDIATVAIPAATTVTSSNILWNGVMAAPVETTVELPQTSGQIKTVSSAIEIGSSTASLSFNTGIRLLMPEQAGKKVGYIAPGGTFTEITTTGTADTQAAGNALPDGGSFKMNVGQDMVIWTKHFTKFVAYTETVNTAPVANNDAITMSEDTQVSPVITNNDSAVDILDLTSIGIASGPDHGALTVNNNGSVTYKPVQDYFGTDTFTYTIKDKKGKISAPATVSITVLSVNDAPVAINDFAATGQDTPVIITVIANDSDTDGTLNPATITITNNASNGSLSVNGDGTVTYTPDVNFNGTATFSYRVKDNNGLSSNIATVTITVNKVVVSLLAGKIANDQSICNNSAPSALIEVTAASGDDGNYTYQWQQSVTGPASGFTDISGATNINYTPGTLTQSTWFRRVVTSNTSQTSAESNVIKITVAPVIINAILPYSGLTIYCGTGDPDKISGGTPTGGGSTVYTYQWQSSTDNVNFSNIPGATAKDYDPGVVSVTTYYRRRVTSGSCSAISSNTIVITIQPALINNVISANQNVTSGATPEMLNGLLPSGGNGNITYLWESSITGNTGFAPAAGINNTINYSPAAVTKTTLFRRKIMSGTCENYSNIIQVTVTNSNSTPIVVADSFTAVVNTPLVIAAPGLLNNDSDPDNDPLTASLTSQPANGTVTVNANGSFIYTPNFNFTGTDNFNYQACDNGSPQLCQTRTVTIQVSGQPVIGLAKAVSTPALQPDGSYNLAYTLRVANMGNTDITQVQVTDDLSKTFPAPVKYKLIGQPVASGGGLSGNASFNGNTDKNLLAANSSLLQGETGIITININVELSGGFGTYFNSATASGTGHNIKITDISTSGNDPDPNHNGNPDDVSESDATQVTLNGNAIIGIAKSVGTPIKQADNSNLVTYTITVKNMGNVPLQNVQVFDDLIKTFPAPLQFTVDGTKITAGVLKPNLSYNGIGNNNLLAPANSLSAGQVDSIRFTVKVVPDPNNYGPFNNTAIGNAQTPSGTQISDISAAGKEPDPNKDGNPDEKDETPVTLEKATIKVAEGFSPNGDGVNDGFIIENLDGAPISLEVYNRWGNVIFRDNNYKNTWNGICNQGIYTGTNIPDGTYFYIVIKHNGADKYIGSITVNR